MSCTNPQCAFVSKKGGSPLFIRLSSFPAGPILHPVYGAGKIVYIPCGGCLACRRERRMELTLLQCCEASLHEDNWFITLTYDDWKTINNTGLPPYSLDRKHLSDFVQSMRKYCAYNNCKFRFFACGEYGEKFERPHYHLSVFGLPAKLLGIDDDSLSISARSDFLKHGKLKKIQTTQKDQNGYNYWFSDVIATRWPFGNHQIYRANRETFQYVAGYVTKKLTGAAGKDFRESGRVSEFQAQSRPSIGWPWFDRFCSSLSNVSGERLINDVLSISGFTWKTPRVFSKWLRAFDHFDGKNITDRLSRLRSLESPDEPDFVDLSRISQYDKYRELTHKLNNKHKEIQ